MATIEASHPPTGGIQVRMTLNLWEQADLLAMIEACVPQTPTQTDLQRSLCRSLVVT